MPEPEVWIYASATGRLVFGKPYYFYGLLEALPSLLAENNSHRSQVWREAFQDCVAGHPRQLWIGPNCTARVLAVWDEADALVQTLEGRMIGRCRNTSLQSYRGRQMAWNFLDMCFLTLSSVQSVCMEISRAMPDTPAEGGHGRLAECEHTPALWAALFGNETYMETNRNIAERSVIFYLNFALHFFNLKLQLPSSVKFLVTGRSCQQHYDIWCALIEPVYWYRYLSQGINKYFKCGSQKMFLFT